MTTLQDLRAAAELLPAGSAISLPRETLLEVLAEVQTSGHGGAYFTVAELAARLHRSTSTVRTWIEAGLFPGAYHLPSSGKLMTFTKGRLKGTTRVKLGAWRVPASALEAFEAGQRTHGAADPPSRPVDLVGSAPRRARAGDRAELGGWRRVKGTP